MSTEAEDFRALWSAHREPVQRALALTLGDDALAGEAADEAMVRALERWSRGPGTSTIRPGGCSGRG